MHRAERQRLFEVNPGPLKAVDLWLSRYRAFWQSELSNLKHFVEAAQAKEASGQGNNGKNKKRVGGKYGSTATNS